MERCSGKTVVSVAGNSVDESMTETKNIKVASSQTKTMS